MENNSNVEFGNGSIFRILNKDSKELYLNRELGDANNYIMTYVSFVDSSLLYLECSNLDSLQEIDFDYPDNSKLKELDTVYYLSKTANGNEIVDRFKVYFNKKSVNIKILENSEYPTKEEPTYYFKNNRVIFYYDNRLNLIRFIIDNLSLNEYKFLVDIKEKGVDAVIDSNPYENEKKTK